MPDAGDHDFRQENRPQIIYVTEVTWVPLGKEEEGYRPGDEDNQE